MEQVKKDLLPEVFPETGNNNEKRSLEDPEVNKIFVREATVQIRERVISPYLPGNKGQERREQPPQLVVLDGAKGVGKTSILEQTAAFARLKGFIVFYIPHPDQWTDGRSFFCAKAVDNMDPVMDGLSAIRYYNRPAQMHQVFNALIQTHGEDLAHIECKAEYNTPLTENCATLLDLVELGDRLLSDIDSSWRQTPVDAGEIFHQLIVQLRACEEKPVAFIIDNYDRFVGMTCLVDERRQRMHANSIRVIAEDLGRDAIENTSKEMRNGFVMLAVDPTHPFESWRKSRLRCGVDFPLSDDVLSDPSGRNWGVEFRKRVQDPDATRNMYINVPRLATTELKALCSTFVQGGLRKLIDGHQEEETARLVALAGGRGDLMRKIALSR